MSRLKLNMHFRPHGATPHFAPDFLCYALSFSPQILRRSAPVSRASALQPLARALPDHLRVAALSRVFGPSALHPGTFESTIALLLYSTRIAMRPSS